MRPALRGSRRARRGLVGTAAARAGQVQARGLGQSSVVAAEEYQQEDEDEDSEPAVPALHSGLLRLDPPFFLGAATAAYQVEGAAAEGGRKPSIWDDFARRPRATHAGASGDVACDHYNRFREDVDLMASLGFQAYRFSISWSRLIPDGEGEVNEEGAKFYSDLVDELLARGITPWVTLYHWDMPSALESEFGGWLGPKDRITSAFGAYARACFELLGGRVKHWITLNEPWCCAMLGYNSGDHAPGRSEAADTEPYLAAHHMLLAHAEAVRIYREEFAAEQQGCVGITLNADWRQPRDPDCQASRDAAVRAMDFSLGWFAGPVYHGDYPECMQEACGERLPAFTDEERKLLRGSSDFFGLNSYSSNFACPPRRDITGDGYWTDIGVEWWHTDPGWERTDIGWPVVPWGFRELLLYVQRRYSPPQGIVVTENGCAHEPPLSAELDSEEGALVPTRSRRDVSEGDRDWSSETYDDPQRVRFFRAHLAAVHAARAHGADVRGYFAWSLMDNFEWAEGYTKRFGIVRVDYATQERTIKASARFLAKTIHDGGFEAPRKDDQYGGTPF